MSLLRTRATDQRDANPSELRRDLRQRDAVTHAVALLGHDGIMPALEYLKSHAVGPTVIERVLLEPARRRMSA